MIPAADDMGNPMLDPEAPISQEDPYFKFDDHALHYESHQRFILGDAFHDLPEGDQRKFMAHTELHKHVMELEVQRARTEMMVQQAMMTEAQEPAPAEEPVEPAEELAPVGGAF